MNRFYNVVLSNKGDQEYIEFLSNVLNLSGSFHGMYCYYIPESSSLEIDCKIKLKDYIKKYNNFICKIYFDKGWYDITVELCCLDNPRKNESVFYDDIDKNYMGDFIDWLVYQMNDYLGFKYEFAF